MKRQNEHELAWYYRWLKWQSFSGGLAAGIAVTGVMHLLMDPMLPDWAILLFIAVPAAVCGIILLEQFIRTGEIQAYAEDEIYRSRDVLNHYRSEMPNKKSARVLKLVPKKRE